MRKDKAVPLEDQVAMKSRCGRVSVARHSVRLALVAAAIGCLALAAGFRRASQPEDSSKFCHPNATAPSERLDLARGSFGV